MAKLLKCEKQNNIREDGSTLHGIQNIHHREQWTEIQEGKMGREIWLEIFQ